MDVSEEHSSKASSPIVVTESGSVMDVSEEHFEKAPYPIVVSESDSVMDVSEEHSQKAPFPIVVSESGSVMDVSEEHSLKAQRSIVVTELGSVMNLSEEQRLKASTPTLVGTLSRKSRMGSPSAMAENPCAASFTETAQQTTNVMYRSSSSVTETTRSFCASVSLGSLRTPPSSTVTDTFMLATFLMGPRDPQRVLRSSINAMSILNLRARYCWYQYRKVPTCLL
jgi:hypothetical protein